MNITEQRIRTTYEIELTISDIRVALSDYYKSTSKHLYPKAFDFLIMDTDPNQWDDAKIKGISDKVFFIYRNGDTYSYFAYYFGFDGWENAGRWNKNKNVYTMVVYNKGEYLKCERIQ